LGLGAVLPDFRSRGLVSDLVIHNMEWLRRRHGDFAFIATQGNNIPAQRLFMKAGFRPAMAALTLHYWKDN
jgi:ribosomal protein S18 acetylase RimI-like enzyme